MTGCGSSAIALTPTDSIPHTEFVAELFVNERSGSRRSGAQLCCAASTLVCRALLDNIDDDVVFPVPGFVQAPAVAGPSFRNVRHRAFAYLLFAPIPDDSHVEVVREFLHQALIRQKF